MSSFHFNPVSVAVQFQLSKTGEIQGKIFTHKALSGLHRLREFSFLSSTEGHNSR